MWHCLWLCLCSAYGIAYGIPCSFSGGRHPAGLFVLYHIGAVLVNRFRQNFGCICLFPAPGGLLRRCRRGGRWRRPAGACFLCCLPTLPLVFVCPPIPPTPFPGGDGGDQSLFRRGLRPRHPCTETLAALTDPARTGARRGDLPSLLPAHPAFSLLYRPHPPPPPAPPGTGGTQSLLRRGLRPGHPCTEPLAALTAPAIQVPCEREPAARCKNDGNAFLWTMPAAKERGDRGRGTSAFEMVLSPGAGIASAARGQAPQPPAGYHSGKVCRQPAGQATRQRVIHAPAPVPPGFSPGDARGEAPCIRKQKISPFPGGEERSASAGRGDGGSKVS